MSCEATQGSTRVSLEAKGVKGTANKSLRCSFYGKEWVRQGEQA